MLNVLNNFTRKKTTLLMYLLAGSIITSFLLYSLPAKAQDYCFTPETSNNIIYESILQSANNNGPFYLKIYVHVIRDANGNGGQSVQNVDDALAILEEDFNPHNVFFVWDCAINYIDDAYWYDRPSSDSRGIYSVNNHTDGIDIYLFPSESGNVGGRANGVGESSEFWVSGTWDGIPVAQSHIISHEMGHVVNLWHTHHSCESGKWENTNGSNCASAGDYVCDTPADPHMSFNVNKNTCAWTGGINSYCQPPEPISQYNPNTNLIMAYTYPTCMEYFTEGQGERMRSSIATLPYLQNTIIADIACGEDDLCEESNADPQVFLEYPWIEPLINGYNCQDITIEVFKFDYWDFLNIAFPATGNMPAEEKIYFQNGDFWCKDFPGFNCKTYYGLNNPTTVTCGCNQACSGAACPTSCEQRDRNALLALYSSTNGENWNTSWNIDQAIANWHGVTLDTDGCVKVLNLPNNGLSGSLAAEIGSLDKLTFMNLSDNQIAGNIPNSIGNLSSIGVLNLSGNQFNGAIPENLSALSILTFLYLDDNNLSGSIPAVFANMENLSTLYVNNNQLSGNFAPQLEVLCTQLNNSNNGSISSGNNFNQTWDTFCFGGSGELVWPGDLNNDSEVDGTDQLFWGINVGATGPARPNASTNWVGQPAPEWTTSHEGVNGKHQDANGDGIVDNNDLDVVALHMGRTRNNTNSILLSIQPSELNFRVESANSQNDKQLIRLFVEDLQANDVMAHGISGVIHFDNPAISTASIDITGSSLSPNPAYVFQQYNTSNNSLTFAITRTNGTDKLCNGYVATILIDVPITANEINLQLSKGKLVSSNGATKNIANAGFTVPILGVGLGFGSFDVTSYIVHPECNTLGKAVIDAYGGTPPYYYQWNTGVTTRVYEHLLPGFYEVTVSDSGGESKTLSVTINPQEPIYDSNGALICGDVCQTYVNPTGNVSSGVIQAGQLLESDATIPQNATVEFTAGERIRLNTGFSTQQSTRFKGAIEDCE